MDADSLRTSAVEPWSARPSLRVYAFGIAVILVANAPLAVWATAFFGRGAGDARTHAMIAFALAHRGIPHGWTDAYGGGFPVGPHYPMVGWGLSSLLIKLGLAPMVAIGAIGLVALLAAPIAAFIIAVRMGARPFAALMGALFLSWVAPDGYFVGNYEAFFGLGLFAQVVAIPSVIFLFGAIAGGKTAKKASFVVAPVVFAVLAVASHPQVATAALVVALLPALASRDRGVMGRAVRAGLALGLVGAAIYGPGIATLRVPFGWPPMERWKTVGFDSGHLESWLFGGKLLDVGRLPVLTVLWAISLLFLLTRLWRPTARAAAVGSIVTMVLAVSGSALQDLGGVGAFALSFLQPLRVLALVPLVAAGTVLVALEESLPKLRSVYQRRPAFVRLGQGLVLLVFAGMAVPARFAVANLVRRKVDGILASIGPNDPCRPENHDGVDAWVGSLVGGRLWYDDISAPAVECEFATGFEIASSVPIAVTSGVGGHVGVHQVAFHELAPMRAGSAERAEALGVRHVLVFAGEPAGDDWHVAHENGPIVLADRVGGTDLVGVGCITSVWTGSDPVLRDRLFTDLVTPRGADLLLRPHAFVALDTTGTSFRESTRDTGACSATGARVVEHPREPGALEADIEAPSPVDVVLRVSAFPTWRVEVDGKMAPTTTVAPGFPSVRVPLGAHHVEAVVATLPWYLARILLALLLAGLCAVPTLTRILRYSRLLLGRSPEGTS